MRLNTNPGVAGPLTRRMLAVITFRVFPLMREITEISSRSLRKRLQ